MKFTEYKDKYVHNDILRNYNKFLGDLIFESCWINSSKYTCFAISFGNMSIDRVEVVILFSLWKSNVPNEEP